MAFTISLDTALRFLTEAVLLLSAVLTLVDFLRKGGRERAVIAAMFSTLGITTVAAWTTALTGLNPFWLTSLSAVALLAHPLLMVLVVQHFRRVQAWILAATGVGWVASAFAYLAQRDPAQLPLPTLLLIVLYFGLGEIYAAYALVAGALRSRGVAQKRLAFAAIGTAILGLLILLAGANLLLPTDLRIPSFATGLLGFAAILAFYLGFSPPAWLVRLWLQVEIARFTAQQTGPRSVTERSALSTDLLADAAVALAGGHHAWVALAPPPRWRMHGRTRARSSLESEPSAIEAAQLAAWLDEGSSGLLTPVSKLPPAAQKHLASQGAGFILAVPILSGPRRWGLILVVLDRPSLFLYETVQTLEVLASQASMAYDAEAAEDEIKAANKELEAFAYSVSHDLRAPLRSMSGFAQILLEEHRKDLSADAQHKIDMIVDSAREMGQLVDDLLAFSRVGKQALALQQVNPEELARHVCEELGDAGKNRDVRIQFGPAPTCQADPNLLKQVYANLLGNALKYTRKKARAEIEVGWTDEAGGAYFVKDNGVGFDMKYADKLFGVFQRLHRAEDYEGTGVGLAIVQRIVTRHGGRVWAKAEVDKGATFFFTLAGGNA